MILLLVAGCLGFLLGGFTGVAIAILATVLFCIVVSS